MTRPSIALAMLFATCATSQTLAQAPSQQEESPFSEFVYERLGATPSIRFGMARKPAALDAATAPASKAEKPAARDGKTTAQPAIAPRPAATRAPEAQL